MLPLGSGSAWQLSKIGVAILRPSKVVARGCGWANVASDIMNSINTSRDATSATVDTNSCWWDQHNGQNKKIGCGVVGVVVVVVVAQGLTE